MLLPGVTITTGPDYRPIEQYQFVRFDGTSWSLRAVAGH